ncbi:MAG: L-rhamnose mutarotase [Phycisphaerales bacterium]
MPRPKFVGSLSRLAKSRRVEACYGPTNPDPGMKPADGVTRFGSVVELNADKEALYRELHAGVWPEVVAAIKKANLRNYNIFLAEIGGRKYLFSYMEHIGTDPVGDLATIGHDETTRDRWWPITDACPETSARDAGIRAVDAAGTVDVYCVMRPEAIGAV